jgi:hypothetical protein
MSCSRATLAVLALGAVAGPARADKAAADVAFAEAKRLIAEGKIAQACPKLELSQRQDPQLGTLLNLADCHEQIGKLATAWAEFREAMELARNRRDEREAFAKERSEKLAPRVAHVTLVKRGDRPDVTASLDGRDVTALVGVQIPVDPGEHTITTRTAGGAAASERIRVERDGQHIEVGVPIEQTAVGDGDRGTGKPGRARRAIAIATGGAGLVAAGVGLYFGKRSFDLYEDSRDHCANNICDPTGAALVDDARSAARKADVLVGAGIAGLAVGAIVWLTAPSEPRAGVTARLVVGPDVVAGVIVRPF